ncbi:hypothetical protein SAMN05660710_00128 [Paracoccus tibetensis]|uniref:Uncharacterized protein n=1 Tax=Paracoccus tibetensis TaxID=336292 RepID=A0A1G5BFV3_9RHOB|nr:hypothetical protein SAMN05660710_00128 [Paracoccus tibetensis]
MLVGYMRVKDIYSCYAYFYLEAVMGEATHPTVAGCCHCRCSLIVLLAIEGMRCRKKVVNLLTSCDRSAMARWISFLSGYLCFDLNEACHLKPCLPTRLRKITEDRDQHLFDFRPFVSKERW